MSEDREKGHDGGEPARPRKDERPARTVLPERAPPKTSPWRKVVIVGGGEEEGSSAGGAEAGGGAGERGAAADATGFEVSRGSGEHAGMAPARSARTIRQGQQGHRRRFGKEVSSEAEWSGERENRPWPWLLGGVLCVGFVLGLFGLRHLRSAAQPEVRPPQRVAIEVPDRELPFMDFFEEPGDLREQCSELIRRFERGEDLAEILRGGAASAERLKGWRARVPEPAPVHFGLPLDLSAMAIGDYVCAVLTGIRRDYSQFGMYFVRENGGLRLDWEASEGFSEVLPGEVGGLVDRTPRMMRALVGRAVFYTPLYPEERYQSYTLQHLEPTVYVWAFAERGSLTDRRLEQRIQRPDMWGSERRVVVMVRRGREGSRPNELEVVRVVGEDWLIPPPESGTERTSPGGE